MKLAGFLLALFALYGCASDTPPAWAGKHGKMEPAQLEEIAQNANGQNANVRNANVKTAKFEIRWHSNIGNAGTNLLQPALSPVLSSDAIYAASAKGSLTRLDRATGRILWRREAPRPRRQEMQRANTN